MVNVVHKSLSIKAAKKVFTLSGQSTKRGGEGLRGCPQEKKNYFFNVIFFLNL